MTTRAKAAGRARNTDAEARLATALDALPAAQYVLAVSGGRDSMVLLHAWTRWRTDAVAVATFDHGTGRAAREAALLAALSGGLAGLRVMIGRRERRGPATEAAWRDARWTFLRTCGAELGAAIVTAHTRDDQLETIVIRALRDPRNTSARGLAAMNADTRGQVVRPLLGVSRSDVAAYAAEHEVRFIEDPSNASRAHLRNRVRLDLLPALERSSPGFGEAMLGLSAQAGRVCTTLDAVVDRLGATAVRPGVLAVPADALRPFDAAGLAVLWPALAERAGAVLDWRGTERLVAFTATAKPSGHIPLSGGARVERTATSFVLRTSGAAE